MFAMIMEYIGHVANIAGAVGGIVAAIGVGKMLAAQRRAAEPVQVRMRLQGTERDLHLPLSLRRRDVSRAELLGRLGMLPMKAKGSRFSLRALADPFFMQQVSEVVDGKSSILVIPCTEEEINQFDV